MTPERSIVILLVALTAVLAFGQSFGRNSADRVRLSDVQTLTLHKDQMTTGRRSRPVQQLSCVGGTGCKVFNPAVVQCYNRGSDGVDVQWECKADMDKSLRFGQIEIICEGYDSPDDPFILKGSCGLEYSLEYTDEGNRHDYGNYHDQHTYKKTPSDKVPAFVGWIIVAGIAWFVWTIYKNCVRQNQYCRTNSDRPEGPDTRGFGTGTSGGSARHDPPPPYSSFDSSFYPGDTCGGTRTQLPPRAAGDAAQGPGFWSGLAAGGGLGYLFGRRNTGYTGGSMFGGGGYSRGPPYNQGYSSGSSWGNASSSSLFGGSSGGTRSASGFGGTRRR
ncbi:hypothetical protein RvY_17290 [Ramazzottius varieornatus]|uniref:Store-operated calcium entry-associated regulatory factor n=1 Tax=Ramazzottius varieornatus TaxID=947166 RepID=A0A1D1W1M4_RAMVA|nr:hypothetical protein RvY_17290 [Ramazzottius varieornatus]